MKTIGFDDISIGLMVVLLGIISLTLEAPSGILADRWSRRNVALLGCASLIASSSIGAISNSVPIYLISAGIWGLYSVFYSGTYTSMLYDTVLEETGSSRQYKRVLGTMRIVEGIPIVISALIGGVIATSLGMRETFWLTIPFLVVAGILLLRFKEPQLHKSTITEPILHHIKQTFAIVLKQKSIRMLVISFVGFGVLQVIIYELYQLWHISIGTPLTWYGPISAIIFATWAVGGMFGRLTNKKSWLWTLTIIVLFAVVSLSINSSPAIIALSQFISCGILIAFGILLTHKLHDNLSSNVRAGAESVVNTLIQLVRIPLAFSFTVIAQHATTFKANYLLICVLVLTLLVFIRLLPKLTQTASANATSF